MMHRIGLSGYSVSLLAVLTFGCTAGNITDENDQAIDIGEGSLVAFVPVDSAGHTIPDGQGGTSKHYFGFTNGDSTFSFDQSVPTTHDYHGTDEGNSQVIIPEGDYYVDVIPNVDTPGTPRADYVSPIFPHVYDHTCTDFFKKNDIACAIYRFRLYSSNFPSHPKGIMVDGIIHSLPLKKIPDGDPTSPPGRITGFSSP